MFIMEETKLLTPKIIGVVLAHFVEII